MSDCASVYVLKMHTQPKVKEPMTVTMQAWHVFQKKKQVENAAHQQHFKRVQLLPSYSVPTQRKGKVKNKMRVPLTWQEMEFFLRRAHVEGR